MKRNISDGERRARAKHPSSGLNLPEKEEIAHMIGLIGDDCYDERATIVDPTLWSYDPEVEGIWVGTMKDGRHHPHGKGLIWDYGRAGNTEGEIIELAVPVSPWAQNFLEAFGAPLDYHGWDLLAHAPVEGWPAAEIIAAMDDTPALAHMIPIDIVGMLTDRNPGSCYLKER